MNNIDENADRKYKYHNQALSTVPQSVIDAQSLRKYQLELIEKENTQLLKQQVYKALQKLTEKQRTVLLLCAVQGLSQEKAAQYLGCSQQNISKLYKAAIRKMRKILDK